jgi:hypothetical protein
VPRQRLQASPPIHPGGTFCRVTDAIDDGQVELRLRSVPPPARPRRRHHLSTCRGPRQEEQTTGRHRGQPGSPWPFACSRASRTDATILPPLIAYPSFPPGAMALSSQPSDSSLSCLTSPRQKRFTQRWYSRRQRDFEERPTRRHKKVCRAVGRPMEADYTLATVASN